MRKNKGRIISASLSELVEKFSQQNIIAEIEKRYQSAPAKLIPISLIDDAAVIHSVVLPETTIDYFASRLKEKGFYNPLVVRTKEDGRYEVILGRKRFFGAKRAGMLSLPCAFAEVEDEEMLLMLLADTRDQREANVVEMALVCHELSTKFGYRQQTLADLSHQSRSQVTNILRILKLPEEVRRYICLGELSYGHGRALACLAPEEATALARRIRKEGLSVREVEALIQRNQEGQAERTPKIRVDGRRVIISFSSEEDALAFASELQPKAK